MTARRRKQIAAACHRDAISAVSGDRQYVEVMPLSTIAARTGLTALFLLGLSPAIAAPCPAPLLAEVLAPPSAGHTEVSLACDLALPPDAVVGKRLVFAGKAASGARLDCHGARLVGGGGVDTGPDRIVIRSRGQTWQAMAVYGHGVSPADLHESHGPPIQNPAYLPYQRLRLFAVMKLVPVFHFYPCMPAAFSRSCCSSSLRRSNMASVSRASC